MDITTPPYGAEFDHPQRQVKRGDELRPGHVIDWRPLASEPVLLGTRIAADDLTATFEAKGFVHDIQVTLTEAYTVLPYYRPCRDCGTSYAICLPATSSKWSSLCESCIQNEI